MTVLNELHQDHVNLHKLLAVLANKLAKLRRGETPNFMLLADAVDYIGNYADRYHHPREDEMYHYFHQILNHPDVTQAIERCMDDHQALKKYGDELIEAVNCILNDAVVPMDAFATKLEAFLEHQVAHLNLEETMLFPLLEANVTQEQWAALEGKLPKIDDPLFGEQQKERYLTLYAELLKDAR